MNPENKDFIDETGQALKDYVDTKSELIKLEVAESAAKITASLFSSLLIMVIALMLIIFMSLMLGYYFSYLLNSYTFGFGIIAGLYSLMLLFVILTRKSLIERPIINKVIRIIFNPHED